MEPKYCFLNTERLCDLSCRAAFQTDDPMDPVGCMLVWCAQTASEAAEAVRDTLDARQNGEDREDPSRN